MSVPAHLTSETTNTTSSHSEQRRLHHWLRRRLVPISSVIYSVLLLVLLVVTLYHSLLLRNQAETITNIGQMKQNLVTIDNTLEQLQIKLAHIEDAYESLHQAILSSSESSMPEFNAEESPVPLAEDNQNSADLPNESQRKRPVENIQHLPAEPRSKNQEDATLKNGQELLILKTELASVTQELNNVRTEEKKNQLILATHDMERAIQSQQAFSKELMYLKEQTQEYSDLQPYLNILEKHSNQSILSPTEMKRLFSDSVKTLSTSSDPAQTENSLQHLGESFFTRLVTVRKVGADHQGNDLGSVLARSAAHLEKDAFADAISELKILDLNTYPSLQNWVTQTNAYLETQDALDKTLKYVKTMISTPQIETPKKG